MNSSENSNACHTWCHTQSISSTWIIHYFSECTAAKSNKKFLESQDFKLSNTSLKLKLFPKGSADLGMSHSWLVAEFESEYFKEEKEGTFITLSFLKNDGESFVVFKETEIVSCEVNCKLLLSFADLQQSADVFLPDDTLTIVCKITTCSTLSHSTIIPPCTMGDNFHSLMKSKELSDVTILVDGKSFCAHKAILAARSPVFAAMFRHPVEENLNSEVTLTDIDGDTMEKLLEYIYSGTYTDVNSFAEGLLVAADKYGLERLKSICEVELCFNLAEENVVQLFNLAVKYSASCLKRHAKEYFVKNAMAVVQSEEWKEYKDNETIPELLEAVADARNLNDLFKALCSSMTNKNN